MHVPDDIGVLLYPQAYLTLRQLGLDIALDSCVVLVRFPLLDHAYKSLSQLAWQ